MSKQGVADRLVAEADIIQFERDGAICLRGLFDEEWISLLREAIDRAKSDRTGIPGYYADTFLWQRDDDVRRFVFESPAAAIARQIMRSNGVRFYYDHIFVKEPGTEQETPWHHDLPYWPVEGNLICSIWLALDPVTKASSGLEYVAGSHRWGKRFGPEAFTANSPAIEGAADTQKIPDISAHRGDYTLLNWDMEPGDCLVHHALAVHGSGGNTTIDCRRRAIATRWVGDDAVYAPENSSYERLKDIALRSGGTLNSPMFPVIV